MCGVKLRFFAFLATLGRFDCQCFCLSVLANCQFFGSILFGTHVGSLVSFNLVSAAMGTSLFKKCCCDVLQDSATKLCKSHLSINVFC